MAVRMIFMLYKIQFRQISLRVLHFTSAIVIPLLRHGYLPSLSSTGGDLIPIFGVPGTQCHSYIFILYSDPDDKENRPNPYKIFSRYMSVSKATSYRSDE